MQLLSLQTTRFCSTHPAIHSCEPYCEQTPAARRQYVLSPCPTIHHGTTIAEHARVVKPQIAPLGNGRQTMLRWELVEAAFAMLLN